MNYTFINHTKGAFVYAVLRAEHPEQDLRDDCADWQISYIPA